MDQNGNIQVNKSLYCEICTESVDHLIQCKNVKAGIVVLVKMHQHKLWKLLNTGNYTGFTLFVRLKYITY